MKLLIILLVIIVVAVVACPLLLIWSFNGLFSLGLDYGFMNWLYALVLILILGGSSSARS